MPVLERSDTTGSHRKKQSSQAMVAGLAFLQYAFIVFAAPVELRLEIWRHRIRYGQKLRR